MTERDQARSDEVRRVSMDGAYRSARYALQCARGALTLWEHYERNFGKNQEEAAVRAREAARDFVMYCTHAIVWRQQGRTWMTWRHGQPEPPWVTDHMPYRRSLRYAGVGAGWSWKRRQSRCLHTQVAPVVVPGERITTEVCGHCGIRKDVRRTTLQLYGH